MVPDGDARTLATYTDDEYDYTIAYPNDWSVEQDSGNGTTFEAPAPSSAGAVVFVESDGLTATDAAAAFLDELDTDENVRALELLAQRDTQLENGQTAQVVECAYIDDSCEPWWLSYLFVRDDDTGYTVGVDWNDAAFDATAAAMLASFALEAN